MNLDAINIDTMTILTLLVGMVCLKLGVHRAAAITVVSSLLGASAALLIGDANIQPAHLLLGFTVLAALMQWHELQGLRRAFTYPEPGFWLLCFVVYGVASAVSLPLLFERSMNIIPLGSSEYSILGGTAPLSRVSSNFTQSVYMIANLVCFATVVALGSTRKGFGVMATAILAYALANVLFAAIDLVTYTSGTQGALEFMRNAKYAMHHEEEIQGLKRIVGSFPEASTFARSTLGVLGFTATLWLCGRRPLVMGALAAVSLLLVVLSTSSTGLAGLLVLLAVLVPIALWRGSRNTRSSYGTRFVACIPVVILAIGVFFLVNESAWVAVNDYFDALLFNKMGTDSGNERSGWNTAGWDNFLESYGLGVGLGTVRTSSILIALLSNVGVLGTAFYLFFWLSLVIKRGAREAFPTDVRLAALVGCMSLTIGDLFAASTVEQGLFFYALAALAAAYPEHEQQAETASDRADQADSPDGADHAALIPS